MKVYLEKFEFPTPDMEWSEIMCGSPEFKRACYNNIYPFKILPEHIRKLDFTPITVLYGTNGSGKSTMLNVIAERLGINRNVKINKSTFLNDYVKLCDYQYKEVPLVTKMITSDDVFSNLFLTREKNEIIDRKREEMIEFRNKCNAPGSDWLKNAMEDEIGDGDWVENIDVLRKVLSARGKKMTGSKFARKVVGNNIIGKSNGETAMEFFYNNVDEPGLYLFDEPENSLSAAHQRELAQFLFESVRFFGAQVVISTHSPFMLSMPEAKIYNLDDEENFVTEDWTSLSNMIEYYNLFSRFSEEFKKTMRNLI